MDFRFSEVWAYIFSIQLQKILIYNVLKWIGQSIYLLQHYSWRANRITDIETGINKVKYEVYN